MVDSIDFLDWTIHPDGAAGAAAILVNLLNINAKYQDERLGLYIKWNGIKVGIDVGGSYAFEDVSLVCPFCGETYTNDVVLSTTDTFLLGIAYACGTQIEYRQHYDAVHPRLTPIKIRRSSQCQVIEESNKPNNEDTI